MSEPRRSARVPIDRRTVVRATAAAGLAAAGLLPRVGHAQPKTTTVDMQLGWSDH